MFKELTLKGEQKKVLFLPSKDPIQIKGVAGSGKTTVAIYRARHLLETQNTLFSASKIAIFTYNKTLASYIRSLWRDIINAGCQLDSDEIKHKMEDNRDIKIVNFHRWAYEFAEIGYNTTILKPEQIQIIEEIKRSKASTNSNILDKSSDFLIEEISWIKGKLLNSKKEYLEAKRIGRGVLERVTLRDREEIWDIYIRYNQELKKREKVDFDDYAIKCLEKIENNSSWEPPFTHIIIDEAQDLKKSQILVISKLVSEETNSITILADAAQRIYKSGFTWSEVGINIRGNRTIEFKKNYRNSVYIVRVAISLLDNEEDKSEFIDIEPTISSGEKPIIGYFKGFNAQLDYLKGELQKLKNEGKILDTVILHKTNEGVFRIKNELENNGFKVEFLNSTLNYNNDSIKICTMSSVKGLEFNNVFIMDLTEGVIPSQLGVDKTDEEDHISTERRLLYTCITRARICLYLIVDKDNPSRYISEISDGLLNNITNYTSDDINYDVFF